MRRVDTAGDSVPATDPGEENWTDEAPDNGYEGIVGITVGVTFWPESSSNPCHLENTLYCFEQ